ncbi:phosphoribosyltransferase [Marinicella sediminis]|uniref:Phosphoribosyltransferase n=1 Tax=Marinicella sediminis TaxID=1792834 RepID=A0ABV7J9Q6_9GAMM|nr:phosphoribosyltransferase [Marinicella sediminis]
MLSNNPYSLEWLNQFQYSDKKVAKDFLNEFEYVESQKIIRELKSFIENYISKTKDNLLLIPVRDIKPSYGAIFSINNNNHGATILLPNVSPGSEALISNLVTQINRAHKSRCFDYEKKSITVNKIRKEAVKTILLVDDVVASGSTSKKFLKSLFANKTLNSWVSGNYVKIVYLAYMCSKTGENAISKHKQKIELMSLYSYPTFDDMEYHKYKKYYNLVYKYSDKSESMIFGYDKCFGKAFFEYSIPNNTPAILWKSYENYLPNTKHLLNLKSWVALFPGRAVPELVSRNFKSNIKRNKNSLRYSFLHTLKSLEKKNKNIDKDDLYLVLKSEYSETREIVKNLQRNNLIDSNLSLTKEGYKELKYLKKRRIEVDYTNEFYYPLSCHD